MKYGSDIDYELALFIKENVILKLDTNEYIEMPFKLLEKLHRLEGKKKII